ncbi:MAG: hypothetical protein WBA40_15805, partial [Roseiarcus sp.]
IPSRGRFLVVSPKRLRGWLRRTTHMRQRPALALHDREAIALEARDEAFRDDRGHQLGRLRFR